MWKLVIQLRWESLSEAELVMVKNVLVLELSDINLSYMEEDREKAFISVPCRTC